MDVDFVSLGQLLRRHRASAGLTQEELAERAGISARTVSDVERGLRGAVYRGTAERLADALGLEEDERAEFRSVARGGERRAPRVGGSTVEDRPLERLAGLPAEPTSLIGRRRELDLIISALGTPELRLLTLTGPGGIGKTRLAVEAATRTRVDFEDGAFFVSLAANRDPALVASIISHALEVKQANEPMAETLKGHLQGKQVLLVLDTFEHVLDAAPLIGHLLGSCPGLKVLATSRAPLHLRGEREIALTPLGLPAHMRSAEMGDLGGYPAIALFVERARAVKPDFQLDTETGPIVAEICRRVDGLPLAIELAAARVKHLSLGALRDHLEHRLRVLTGGPLDLPLRLRAMRDTVSWSYDLLQLAEQELFRQLSIFAGGWTLDAVELVCPSDAGGQDVLEGTSALIDWSLVFVAEGMDENPRYGMLDVLQEYAAEQRDLSGETEVLGRRHAEYFLRLAERAEPELGRSAQDAWYRRLAADHENLRAALRWSLERGEADQALRLSGALWQFWRRRGDLTEGRTWLDAALRMDEPVPVNVRGKALWGAAWLAYHQGDYEQSESFGQELEMLARQGGDRLGWRHGLTVLGQVAMAQGRYAEALQPLQEALAICRELGPSWYLATSLLNLGVANVYAGQGAQGEAQLDEALSLYREYGDRHFTARATTYLGYSALQRGDLRRAESLLASSLQMSRDLGEPWGVAEALEGLSAVAAALRDGDRAARIAGAAMALRETVDVQQMPFDRVMIAQFLANARARTDETAWRSASDQGRAMGLDEAVAYSLAERPS